MRECSLRIPDAGSMEQRVTMQEMHQSIIAGAGRPLASFGSTHRSVLTARGVEDSVRRKAGGTNDIEVDRHTRMHHRGFGGMAIHDEARALHREEPAERPIGSSAVNSQVSAPWSR